MAYNGKMSTKEDWERIRIKLGLSKEQVYAKQSKKISRETQFLVIKDNILKYGDFTCEYCLRVVKPKDIHFDHRTPKSKGGRGNKENVSLSCSTCNLRKKTRRAEEFPCKGRQYV